MTQRVFITGVTSGIGQALARAWVKKGARVWGAARRAAELDALAAETGGAMTPVVLDVSDDAAVVKRVAALDAEVGGFDVGVANAGIGGPTPTGEASWEDVSRILRTNVLGATATLHTLAQAMVKRGHGRLCGVASLAAYRGIWAHGPYSGSKSYLSMYLESIRVDLAGSGITATCVYPGVVNTPINAHLKERPPFTMEVEDAALRIIAAVERGDRRVTFPKMHVLSMRMMQLLPDVVWESVANRLPR